MDVKTERKDRTLVIRAAGRLDGFGAGKLEEAIRTAIRDDDLSIIIDMEGVSYLSSAGIRVFLHWKKKMKERNGSLSLCCLQEFPQNVLEMAGFLTVIPAYPTAQAALLASLREGDDLSLLQDLARPAIVKNGTRFTVEKGAGGAARLLVTGDLAKVLFSSIEYADIHTLRFSEVSYALGLGALGQDARDAMRLLGEMIVLHGSLVWMPTDGNMTPDFFTPARETGKVKIYTGYAVALQGPFHDIYTIESGHPQGLALEDLYSALFSLAKERKRPHTGIIAIALQAISTGVRSSEIRHSPIRENAPLNAGSIMDPENYDEWNDTITVPRYSGDTLVAFGFGIDYSCDLSSFGDEMLRSISYIHPKERKTEGLYLHIHGVVFRDIPWDAEAELNSRIQKILSEGTFVDMRHLQNDTRILRAKCGVCYISELARDW